MKYDVTVTGLGDMALAFLDPAMEMRFVILFNDDAPAELAELSILHTKGEMTEAPAPGVCRRFPAPAPGGPAGVQRIRPQSHVLVLPGSTPPGPCVVRRGLLGDG